MDIVYKLTNNKNTQIRNLVYKRLNYTIDILILIIKKFNKVF